MQYVPRISDDADRTVEKHGVRDFPVTSKLSFKATVTIFSWKYFLGLEHINVFTYF